jgi:lipopolysaccharide biosynthesis glycosyltransferase
MLLRAMMKRDLAICYVSDLDYLFATLLSIASLRRFVGPEVADVFIFSLDPETPESERVREYARELSVVVLPLPLKDRLRFDVSKWNRTHVPHSALGRFFIEPLLPTHIGRVLYIDGDTLFMRDPTPLLNFTPPIGQIAAVEDVSFFLRADSGRHGEATRSYFKELGVNGDTGYFNSGLIQASRETWKRVTEEAADFFFANVAKCRFHDQSALNAVTQGRRIRLSPAWNFQTPFRYWGVEKQVAPRIVHFTEFPKPWMGQADPWSDMEAPIRRISEAFVSLRLPRNELDGTQLAALSRQKKARRARLWTVFALRLLQRRKDIRQLLKSAAI